MMFRIGFWLGLPITSCLCFMNLNSFFRLQDELILEEEDSTTTLGWPSTTTTTTTNTSVAPLHMNQVNVNNSTSSFIHQDNHHHIHGQEYYEFRQENLVQEGPYPCGYIKCFFPLRANYPNFGYIAGTDREGKLANGMPKAFEIAKSIELDYQMEHVFVLDFPPQSVNLSQNFTKWLNSNTPNKFPQHADHVPTVTAQVQLVKYMSPNRTFFYGARPDKAIDAWKNVHSFFRPLLLQKDDSSKRHFIQNLQNDVFHKLPKLMKAFPCLWLDFQLYIREDGHLVHMDLDRCFQLKYLMDAKTGFVVPPQRNVYRHASSFKALVAYLLSAFQTTTGYFPTDIDTTTTTTTTTSSSTYSMLPNKKPNNNNNNNDDDDDPLSNLVREIESGERAMLTVYNNNNSHHHHHHHHPNTTTLNQDLTKNAIPFTCHYDSFSNNSTSTSTAPAPLLNTTSSPQQVAQFLLKQLEQSHNNNHNNPNNPNNHRDNNNHNDELLQLQRILFQFETDVPRLEYWLNRNWRNSCLYNDFEIWITSDGRLIHSNLERCLVDVDKKIDPTRLTKCQNAINDMIVTVETQIIKSLQQQQQP